MAESKNLFHTGDDAHDKMDPLSQTEGEGAGQRVGAPTYYLAHLLIVRIKDVKSEQLS